MGTVRMNACVERLRRLYNLALRQGFVTLSFTPECTQPVVGNANQMLSIYTELKSWMYLPYHPDLLHLAGKKINTNCVLISDDEIDFGFVVVGERWYPTLPGSVENATLWQAKGLHRYAEHNNQPISIPVNVSKNFIKGERYLKTDLAVMLDGEVWSSGCYRRVLENVGKPVIVVYMIENERPALAFVEIDGLYYPLIKVGERPAPFLPARQAQ